MFGRLRPPGICFREATHLNPRISVQNLCETSMFRTLSTRWLMPRGVWAWVGAAGAFASLVAMGVLPGRVGSLCGAAPSLPWLVVGRVVQGIGAALLFPASMAVLTDAFPADRRDRAIGTIVGLAGVGAAVGPFVGGFVADRFGWRWIFYLNLPV